MTKSRTGTRRGSQTQLRKSSMVYGLDALGGLFFLVCTSAELVASNMQPALLSVHARSPRASGRSCSAMQRSERPCLAITNEQPMRKQRKAEYK